MPVLTPDPTLKKITRWVLYVHLIFLAFVFFGSSLLPVKAKRKPLIVKTITPKAAIATVQTQTKTTSPAKAATAPKPTPPKQTVQVKPKTEKTAPPKPKIETPVVKKSPPTPKKDPAIADKTLKKNKTAPPKKENPPENRAKISDRLKKELEESIAKIEGKKQNPTHKQQAPRSQTWTPIQLHIDSIDSELSEETPSDYPNQMISYLHQSLNLPEFGEVKIQLTLRQDGSVAKLVVLNTESEKNKRYLEESLPRLRLPSFNGSFTKKPEHTFVLTFCNEI